MDYKRLLATLHGYKKDNNKNHTLKLTTDTLHKMGKFVAAVPRENFFASLKGDGDIVASDGETMSKMQVACFIGVLVTFNVSYFINFSKPQSRDSTFSAPVPYILYMHKLHNKTPYNDWKEAPDVLLGTHFRDLRDDMDKIQAIGGSAADLPWSTDELMELRAASLVWGGKKIPATGWNLKKSGIDPDFDVLSKATRMILLQTWCHNAESRHKYMINDVLDWDNMPKSLDAEAKVVASEDKMPWEDFI